MPAQVESRFLLAPSPWQSLLAVCHGLAACSSRHVGICCPATRPVQAAEGYVCGGRRSAVGGSLGTPWTSPPGPSPAPRRDTLSLAPGTEQEAHRPLETHTQAWIPAGAMMLGST